jgi:hypothetical protein
VKCKTGAQILGASGVKSVVVQGTEDVNIEHHFISQAGLGTQFGKSFCQQRPAL